MLSVEQPNNSAMPFWESQMVSSLMMALTHTFSSADWYIRKRKSLLMEAPFLFASLMRSHGRGVLSNDFHFEKGCT